MSALLPAKLSERKPLLNREIGRSAGISRLKLKINSNIQINNRGFDLGLLPGVLNILKNTTLIPINTKIIQ